MIRTLDRVYALDGIDTIIIGRGGGSAEDLHCFNDEALARKLYESPFPVISAVGHETDFTICDFVADVRASTPSHAAELAVPDMRDLIGRVDALTNLLKSKVLFKYNSYNAQLNTLKNRVSPTYLERIFQNRQLELDRITDKMANLVNRILHNSDRVVSNLIARIDALSPLKVMSRGFSVTFKDGICISSANNLKLGDNITVKLIDGDVDCLITNINNKLEG